MHERALQIAPALALALAAKARWAETRRTAERLWRLIVPVDRSTLLVCGTRSPVIPEPL
jgi:uncharacterized membrane protein